MVGIKELITPEWEGEVYLNQYWNELTTHEQETISQRVQALFANGLPFELKHDKLVYAQIFSMLAGLEIAGTKLALYLQPFCKNSQYAQQMRNQFMDEIAHSIIFTKLAYELSDPYSKPPPFNQNATQLYQFFSAQDDPCVSATLLTIIAEGFVEIIFAHLLEHNIAPKVFSNILQDEQRHLSDSKIYEVLGLLNSKKLAEQLGVLEDSIIQTCFYQGESTRALIMVLGSQNYLPLFTKIYQRYEQQLTTFGLKPSTKFKLAITLGDELGKKYFAPLVPEEKIPLSFARTVLTNYWKEPIDPRMSTTFSLNISALGSVDNCSISPTWRGLSAPSRRSLDTADKPRYVGTLEDLRI